MSAASALAPADVAAPRRRRVRRRGRILASDARHEAFVDRIASCEPATCPRLARAIGAPVSAVRAALRELEAMGSVVRTGTTRGTRWWLG